MAVKPGTCVSSFVPQGAKPCVRKLLVGEEPQFCIALVALLTLIILPLCIMS